MRIGVIDLGTNSIRFAIYDIQDRKHKPRSILKDRQMLRPGEGVFKTGRLKPAVMKKLMAALKRYSRTAEKKNVDFLEAYATSALREAKNRKPFVKAVKDQTGIDLHVISGQTEAEWIAKGVLRFEPHLQGRYVLIDIGGGSTELSFCNNRKVLSSISLPLGAARLSQLFPMAQIPQMRKHVQKVLQRHAQFLHKHKCSFAIGSSGSIRTMVKFSQKQWLKIKNESRPSISRATLSYWVENLLQMTDRQIRQLPGMEQKRVDLMIPAAVLLEELILFLNVEKLESTEYSLRDGLVIQLLEKISRKKA